MTKFSIIAAVDKNFGLGKNGRLAWRLSADMRFFKQVTTAGPGVNMVIMGRRTWESLPERYRPLPDRINCVLTRRKEYPLPDSVLRAENLDAALELAARRPDTLREVFVIGGAEVYAQAITRRECARVFLTRLGRDFDCDVFFPQDPLSGFGPADCGPEQKEGDITFRFCKYERAGARG